MKYEFDIRLLIQGHIDEAKATHKKMSAYGKAGQQTMSQQCAIMKALEDLITDLPSQWNGKVQCEVSL